MGLIANFENVVLRDKVESGPCGLKVVYGLTHVAFGGEDESGETLVVVFDLESVGNSGDLG